MGIFDKLFGGDSEGESKAHKVVSWVPLDHLDQLEKVIRDSQSRPQVIFKHSTSCGISSMVLRRFEKQLSNIGEQAQFLFLDLHRYRDISNEVARQFQVHHQSPQVLIIRNGIVVADASHYEINGLDLEKYL